MDKSLASPEESFSILWDTIHSLEATSSTNKKQAILETVKDNLWVKLFFIYALHPRYQFGVKKLPPYIGGVHRQSSCEVVMDAAERLLADKTHMKEFFDDVMETMTAKEYNVLRRICRKDPGVGVSKALANRVWEGLTDTKVYLCKAEPISEKNKKNINFPCYVQKKEDGARCICFCLDETVIFLSASGKEYTKLDHLSHLLKTKLPMVLDGELLVYDKNGNTLSRKEGNGILNKSIKGTITDEEAERVHYVIWDAIIPSVYFGHNEATLPYYQRLCICKEYTEPGFIDVVDTVIVDSWQEVMKQFNDHIRRGHEGVIVKNTDFLWKGKRIKDQLKLKLDLDVTLKVTGFQYGEQGTKYENCLGALNCESSDGILKVSVGSGFSDDFRESFSTKYAAHDFISDPIFIEVRSNGTIKNDEGWSLFLPRMIELRTDKTEADSFETIQSLQSAKCSLS